MASIKTKTSSEAKIERIDVVLEHAVKAIEACTTSLKKNDEKLGELINVVTKQGVALEKLDDIEKTIKEHHTMQLDNIDRLKSNVATLEAAVKVHDTHIASFNKIKWFVVSVVATAILGAILKVILI